MKLYLLRHGESEANAQKILQGERSVLTMTGVRQAEQLARRFSGIPVNVIFTSDYARALKTAEIINKTIQKGLIVTELLRERKHPSDFSGKSIEAPETKEMRRRSDENSDPNWHQSDEENHFDLRDRAQKFIDMVVEREEEKILAVTHGEFIRMLLAVMGNKENFLPIFKYLYSFFKTTNTGITVCEYENPKWSLRTWNDYAHLD